MSMNTWLFRAIRGFGIFVILYLAVGLLVSLVALVVYSGHPTVAVVTTSIAILLTMFTWVFLKAKGETPDEQ